MKTKLRQKGTKLSWKRFFQVNIRKYRDIKFVTTERRRNYLVSELNYHTKNLLTGKRISGRNEKNTNINEEVCLFKLFKNNDDECKKSK